MTFQLCSKIREGIEHGTAVKPLLVFSMTPFYFAIMPGCVRFDALMVDAKFCQGLLKQGQMGLFITMKM